MRPFFAAVVLAASAVAQDARLRGAAGATPAQAARPAPLSESHCRRSRSVWGEIDAAGRFADQLERCDGGGVNVVIFGGSVTHGPRAFDDALAPEDPSHALVAASPCFENRALLGEASACAELSYGAVLERRLNEAFACANDVAQHQVHVKPQKGRGTEYHLQLLRSCEALRLGVESAAEEGVEETCRELRDADIVVLETAMNDHDDTALKAERLVRQLARLPNEPVVYFFVAGLFYKDWESFKAQPRYFSDVYGENQASMLEYYGVSQISVQKAIMADLGRRDGRERWQPFWSRDGRHPSAWGHTVLAELLLWNFQRDLEDLRRTPAAALDLDTVLQQLPDPWLVDPADDRFSFVPAPLTVASVVDDVAMDGAGFALAEDVPGKPGLIATAVGSTVVLEPLPSQEVEGSCEFVLTYLTSYEHMGAMTVEVLLADPSQAALNGEDAAEDECDYAQLKDGLHVVHTDRIDTLAKDDARESLAHEYRLPYTVPAGHDCAWIRVTVADAGDGRRENKIKLLGLTTACPLPAAMLP